MSSTVNINNIIQEIESLDYISKINVMSKIISMLKKTQAKSAPTSTSTNITKIKGLGKEVWQDVNIESYISKEREAWS